MRVLSVRGAVRVDDDTPENVKYWTVETVRELLEHNGIDSENIINIIFSQTTDIRSENPARALRSSGGFDHVPLFCTAEPEYPNTLKKMIRILMTFQTDAQIRPKPVYKNGAENLRSDLVFP
ncbi:chorismate mutase [Spirochaeta lutea]|uniref:chorismate mutase n=1 Tax=Spirochaeta lutea TaxID=1480694 RepID=A0A098R2C2_9SPIO|nr:chorismate mutase [Spirochaeta lutea]KGE73931.1 hypothetical protein DC28_01765 [Spirochaeta lutea]